MQIGVIGQNGGRLIFEEVGHAHAYLESIYIVSSSSSDNFRPFAANSLRKRTLFKRFIKFLDGTSNALSFRTKLILIKASIANLIRSYFENSFMMDNSMGIRVGDMGLVFRGDRRLRLSVIDYVISI